jgi:uncharacterized repeat protein (TIGR01451 family)
MTDTLYNCIAFTWIRVSDALNQEMFFNTGLINAFTLPEFSYTPPLCPDTTASVFVSYPGIHPVNAYWFEYDPVTQLPGDTMATGNPANLGLGNYYVIPVDTNGCYIIQDSNYFMMTNQNPYTLELTSFPAHCNNGSIFISATNVENPPLLYQWSNGQSDSVLSNLTTGIYEVTISDNIGCTEHESVYINQSVHLNFNFVVQPASCQNADGSVFAFVSGGQSPYTYNWSNGNHNSSLSQVSGNTSLSLTVIDVNGCVGTSQTQIGISSPIYVSYTSIPCHCQVNDGRAVLTVNAAHLPYSVQWQTNPVQYGDTLKNVAAGIYTYSITDAQGCSQEGSVIVASTNTINPNPLLSPPVCPSTVGTVSLNPFGSSPPFSYSWSTGSTQASIQASVNTMYSCTITDADGCSIKKDYSINQQNPITIAVSVTPSTCIYALNGSLMAQVSGGIPPYSYSWSSGQNTQSVSGLAQGNYTLVVRDSNGCSVYKYVYLGCTGTDSSCYCSLRGIAYHDQDADCVWDSGETGIPEMSIHLSGMGYAFTDHNGRYEFKVPNGTYTLSELEDDIFQLSSCQPNNMPVSIIADSGCSTTVNFSNDMNLVHDLSIHRFEESPPAPGFPYYQRLVMKNKGTINEDTISAGQETDIQSILISSSPNPYVQPDPMNDPNFFSLSPGNLSLIANQELILHQQYQMDPGIPVNTQINYIDTLVSGTYTANWQQDFTPYDNIFYFTSRIVASWDPNYKEVSPAGEGEDGEISRADSVLTYTIHFQNTGNYYAQQVVLIDTLDPALNPLTLRPVYSSHPSSIQISENGIVTITFPSIMLAWQSIDERGSCCMCAFSVKLKHGLGNGTRISNAADIYFDYNEPVRTNSVVNTLNSELQVTEILGGQTVRIFPNPARDEITIESKDIPIQKIEIFDVDGRRVLGVNDYHSLSYKLNINSLKTGIYILTISDIMGKTTCEKLAII